MSKLSAKEIAYKKIKSDIINQVLKPQEKIIEESYAEKLGVSRTPLREAIRNLEQDGFVTSIRNRGAFVKSFNNEEAYEYFLIRKLLEPIMVVEASKNQTEELMKELERALIASENEESPGIVLGHLHDYHDTLQRMSGMSVISQILSNISDYTKMITKKNVYDASRLKEVNREHREIFESMKSREYEILNSLVLVHVLNSNKSYTNNN